MPITLQLQNENTDASAIHIYRSETRTSIESLDDPIAVIAGTETEFTDTTPLLNKLYYYRVGVVVDGDLIIGSEHPLMDMPYRGPGPFELKMGDYETGYFGLVKGTDFIAGSALPQIAGIANVTYVDISNWFKLIKNGVIYYLPVTSLLTRVGSAEVSSMSSLILNALSGKAPVLDFSWQGDNYSIGYPQEELERDLYASVFKERLARKNINQFAMKSLPGNVLRGVKGATSTYYFSVLASGTTTGTVNGSGRSVNHLPWIKLRLN